METVFNIRLEGTTLYVTLGYELSADNAPALQEGLKQYLDIAGITEFITFVEDERKNKQTGDSKWLKKVAEAKQQQLDYFAAHNDVVAYQMKLGQEND